MSDRDHTGAAEVLLTAREDLGADKQGDKFILNDRVKHTFTQLGVGEYLVFRCFDGKSTVQEIADRLRNERGVIVSVASIERLRDRLHEKQLLIGPGETILGEESPFAGRSLVQRLIMIDLGIAINPDRLLTRLYHRIKSWTFRPAFFVGLFIAAAVATQIWITSWDEIRRQLSVLDIKDSLLVFYPCAVITILIHEVGHGVSTKGFGGVVPKMGVFLYFFVVVFYTDVSASWMFASKFRRLVVLFAGAITNVAQWSLWTVVWHLTHPASLVNRIAFAFMVINAVSLSFTLFPLLRGDGYFILSTALDVPNLSQNSHKYVGALLRRKLIDKTTKLPKATNREALIYVWYSPLQVLFFIVFFTVLATRTAEWLIGNYGFLGFWIIVFVVADRIARPMFRIVPGTLEVVAAALRLGLQDGPGALLAVLTRPFRDAGRWMRRMWKIELLIAVPIALLAVIPYHLHVSAPFQVISSGPVAVRPYTSGIVKSYAVKTGDRVKAGDVIALLLDDDLLRERQAVAASLEEARAKLAALEAGYRPEQVAAADVGARALNRSTALAADELRRVQNLHANAISSDRDLDIARTAYLTTSARARRARAELGMLRHGYRPEERDRQRAVVQRIEHELAAVDQRLAWTKVRALVDGHVVTPSHELERRVGTHVMAGESVAEVVGPTELVARLEVPERFVGKVGLGMPVTLRFFSDPDTAYAARVDAIEPIVTLHDKQPAVGMLSSLARFEGTPPLGTKGIAKIDAGSRTILGLFLDRTKSAAWVVFWSWW